MGSSVILQPPGQPTKGPDLSFRTATQPNIVSFELERIAPPSTLYLQRDDQLIVQAMTFLTTNPSVNFWARVLMASPDVPGQPDAPPPQAIAEPGGKVTQTIRLVEHTLLPVSSTAAAIFTLSGVEGYLLNAGATGIGSDRRGQTFVRASLNRVLGNTAVQIPLFGDYVYGGYNAGWPSGRNISGDDGPGFLTSFQIANPAAGADFTQTVNNRERWRLQSLSALLTTNATVANRIPQLVIDDGANIVFQGQPTLSVPASQAVQVTAADTIPTAAANVVNPMIAIPGPLMLPAGFRIRSLTSNIAAGDTWTNIWMELERFTELL